MSKNGIENRDRPDIFLWECRYRGSGSLDSADFGVIMNGMPLICSLHKQHSLITNLFSEVTKYKSAFNVWYIPPI